MDATQMIDDSILESDEEENEEENGNKRGKPLAMLRVFKNEHIPETELPLYLGDNVLGRDPNTCTLLLPAPSVSKQHSTICISVFHGRGRHSAVVMEALVWDLGSMNGTRKGCFKLTPQVRYALSEGDRLVVADIPCQYVSCAVDKMFGHGDMRTPVNRDSGERARWSDALREKVCDTSTDTEKCVNGDTKAPAMVSSPDQDETSKTPARTRCLSFEQTPTQPQGTLVPESDSDSDGERGGRRERQAKTLVSDSDSHISSPTCSTFLSPTNKIIPESEDESPITPSFSTKDRTNKCVSFSKEERDVDVGRQQLKKKRAQVIVDDSEEEEERAAPGGREPKQSGQDVPMIQENNVSLSGEDGLPVSIPAVSTDAIHVLDSDTDVEGEEEVVESAGPVTFNTSPPADDPTKLVQFQMDSDTDVDEDDDVLDNGPKSVSKDTTKPPDSLPVVKPTGIILDSDTDVDDGVAAVSDTVTKATPTSLQSVDTADSALSTQPKDFHLDSDTDVEEESDSETRNMCSKIDKTPSRIDLKPSRVESTSAAPHNLHLDSDTDDEVISVPASSKLAVVALNTKPPTTADTGADMNILSDSDTDLEDDAPLLPAAASSAEALSVCLSTAPVGRSTALQSDSDADTDVDEPSMPPAGVEVDQANFRLESDTDVEDEGAGPSEAGVGQTSGLSGEKASGLPGGLVPPLQKCSTPLQLSERVVEEMATQAFVCDQVSPPAMRPVILPSSSNSQEDNDFVVAETQSFVLETRDRQGSLPHDPSLDATQAFCLEPSSDDDKYEQCSRGGSFQLGLSDSSRLQAQALAMENTQAFVTLNGDVNLEATQAYGNISPLDRTSVEDSNLEATQAYGGDEEPARCSIVSERGSQLDFALEATQAYTPEPHSDPEDETEGDERTNIATAETQSLDFPTTSATVMAETQPMSAFEEEENLMKYTPPSSSVHRGKPRKQKESEYLSTAETQPMAACEDEESDDEDLIPAPRKNKAKPLQLEEEETQPMTSSELCAVETQPMCIHDDDNEEDEIVTKAPSLKRRGRPQTKKLKVLTSTHISNTESQPVASCEMDDEEEHEEEETKAGLKKAKGQPQGGKRRESEAGTSGISSRSKRGSRARLGEDEMQEEPPKRQTRGKGKALSSTRGRRGKVRPEEEEESEEGEEVEQAKRGRGRKMTKHQNDELEEKERLEMERKTEKDRLLKEQEEQVRLGQALKEQEKERIEEELREQQLEKERKEEQERLQSENAVREEKLRLEQERAEREEKERLDRERKERERLEREEKERIEGERKEKEEQERLERERKEKEEQERLKSERAEREEERLEQERAEREERERLEREERERIERERKEQEEKERFDRIRKEKEEQERLEREKKEKEEQERLKCEKAKRKEELRLEHERAEREEERLEREREERERLEREEKERIERERKEKEEQERLKCDKAEREEKERLETEEKDRIERERKEREEKERLERVQKEVEEQDRLEREKKEREHQVRLEREKKEREEGEKQEKERLEKEAKEKQIKEQQESKDEENKPKMSTRGPRASRRTIIAPSTTKPEPDPNISTNDDIPARRTRSRSNSSNSVSSERSVSSVTTLESRGRGRGRGVKKTSQPALENICRNSNRRRTVAAEREATEQNINHVPAPGILSRSNSTNSLNSTNSIPPINSQSDQNSAPKATARGRKSRKVEGSSHDVSQVDGEEKADSQQPSTTRGRRRASANASGSQTQAVEIPAEDSLLPKRNVRGRGQISIKCETLATPVAAVVNDGDEAKGKGKGSKRELEDDESRGAKISRGRAKAQRERGTEEAEEEEKEETKEENLVPVPAKRRGRASTTQGRRNAKESCPEVEVKEENKKMEEEIVERKARGRQSVAHKKKEERAKEGGTSALNSMDQDASAEASEVPQTTTSSAPRKRAAPMDSSPVAKTPRSSAASPGAGSRLRAASQAYKVLFTGVADEAGERAVPHLGGSLAKGVADMTCLVTDKVRRTVKFLCAVARGVPIVTTHWLEKSGKAGSFLSPNAFIVKDTEQEKKFNFCLQESLRIASIQPLLQGYEIHVTKSVKPEPMHMKDIISCSGASFLPKMPSSHKAQTIVISCEEDWSLCGPAVSASLPVVSAEFILTGILQQKIDFNTHTLPAPTTNPQSAGGRGRGRKKT